MPNRMATLDDGTRRTGEHRARRGGRSERVVRDVLQAVTTELARVGYGALRIEDVAVVASVNKTTIYRRWPTKAELVGAALRSMGQLESDAPNTGSLAEDLRVLLARVVAFASSPGGLTLARLLAAEMENADVEALARSIRAEIVAVWVDVIASAVLRGEIPPGSDGRLIADLIMSPAVARLRRRERVDEAYLRASVDLVVAGAKAGGAVPKVEEPRPPESGGEVE